MRQAAEKLADQLGALSKPGEDRHEVGSTWHDSGTLFMGDDPAASVTDSLGHFHHIANVACVDQALFPTVGSANPVLTGLCLSRRVAEVIVDRSVSTPALGAAETAAEEAEGFTFLLAGSNGARWLPNNGRLNASRPHLILGGSIIEVHGDAGAGVLFFLRAPRPPPELDDANFYGLCPEIQIDDTGYDGGQHRFGSALHRTGAIYGLYPARRAAQKQASRDGAEGYWNEYRILAVGARLSVRLNGNLVSEGDLPDTMNGAGFIALQYHTGKVQFRALRVRRARPAAQ